MTLTLIYILGYKSNIKFRAKLYDLNDSYIESISPMGNIYHWLSITTGAEYGQWREFICRFIASIDIICHNQWNPSRIIFVFQTASIGAWFLFAYHIIAYLKTGIFVLVITLIIPLSNNHHFLASNFGEFLWLMVQPRLHSASHVGNLALGLAAKSTVSHHWLLITCQLI